MKSIYIIGTSGSGKTTLAQRISKLICIPCIDMDDHYWLPDWQIREEKEFIQIIDNLTQKDSWIISGNHSTVQTMIWGRADTIIWLDYSQVKCLYQAFKRSIILIISNQHFCNGNFESFSRLFVSKKSILLWIIRTYKRRKVKYSDLFRNKTRGKRYHRFSNSHELNAWLDSNFS